MPITQRESPAFAQTMYFGVTMAVTDVHPLVSCPLVVD
jgi:hypothetical protein